MSKWTLATILTGFSSPVMASTGGSHESLTQQAPVLFRIPLGGDWNLPVSNSMVMMFIAVAIVCLISQLATRRMSIIPGTLQNLFEWLIESLFNFFSQILGPKLTRRTFWFFGSAFIIILVENWMGLIPGVGMLQITDETGAAAPLFRGANADLNLTLAMGLLFSLLWFYWTVTEIGFMGFLRHLFEPQGVKGAVKLILAPIFLMVGAIEIVSILLRPISLGARLYGNVFAGETIIHTMSSMVPEPWNFFIGWMPVLPFIFMELLVGLLQALVFTLLTSIFLKMMCDHADDHEDDHAASPVADPAHAEPTTPNR